MASRLGTSWEIEYCTLVGREVLRRSPPARRVGVLSVKCERPPSGRQIRGGDTLIRWVKVGCGRIADLYTAHGSATEAAHGRCRAAALSAAPLAIPRAFADALLTPLRSGLAGARTTFIPCFICAVRLLRPFPASVAPTDRRDVRRSPRAAAVRRAHFHLHQP